MKENDIIDRKDLDSLSNYHKNGGELFDGLQVICERNYQTPLKYAILKSWHIGSVKMDLTQLGKYSESSCILDVDGKIESWPFTMLYVKK